MAFATACPIVSTPIARPPAARLDNITTQAQVPALPPALQAPIKTFTRIHASPARRPAANASILRPTALDVSPVAI